MTEIEFLDPGPAGAGVGDPATHGADGPDAGDDGADDGAAADLRRLVPALAAAVAWVLAAGLTVMASVSTVYRLVYTSGDQHQSISVDAWGRYNAGRFVQIGGHQTRYSVVLIAVAIVLLAAALVGVARLPVARYVAVAGTSAAAALAATLYLTVLATRSTNGARAQQLASDVSLRTDIGSAVWLTGAATAAAAVGVVLAFVLKPPAAPAELEETDERDAPPAETAPDAGGVATG